MKQAGCSRNKPKVTGETWTRPTWRFIDFWTRRVVQGHAVEPTLWNTKWGTVLGSTGKTAGGPDPSPPTAFSSPLSLLPRERRCVRRCVLEGSHACPVLCQRSGLDLLRPACHQTGCPAESAGVLHGLLPLLLPEPHSHLQPEEAGELAVSGLGFVGLCLSQERSLRTWRKHAGPGLSLSVYLSGATGSVGVLVVTCSSELWL